MRALSTVGASSDNGGASQQLFFATSDAPVLMGPQRVDSLFSATSDLTKRRERQVSLNDVVNASRALEETKQRMKRKGAAT